MSEEHKTSAKRALALFLRGAAFSALVPCEEIAENNLVGGRKGERTAKIATGWTGTRSTGGKDSIVEIEDNLNEEQEAFLVAAGMSKEWRDGKRGLASTSRLKLKDDASQDEWVQSRLLRAAWLNSQVPFVTGTGSLLIPSVKSQDVSGWEDGAPIRNEQLEGNFTPIWALCEELCATVSDAQMYFGSLVNAKNLGGIQRLPKETDDVIPMDAQVPTVPVVLWDFRNPIGVYEDKEVYLPDVSTDGGALISKEIAWAPGQQFRGLTLRSEGSVMWKGAMHSDSVRWHADLQSPVREWYCPEAIWAEATPVILMDINCPKGKGKAAILDQQRKNHFVVLEDGMSQLWRISEWGLRDWYGKDCIELPFTFQDRVFMRADEESFQELTEQAKKLFTPRTQVIRGREWMSLDRTVADKAERLVSAGSLRKARQLRARANKFLPVGAIMVDPTVAPRGWALCAQGRAPTVQMHSKQVSIGFTPDALEMMLKGDETELFKALLKRHNNRVRWFYQRDQKSVEANLLTEDTLKQQLQSLWLSTVGVDLRGSFLANQLDAGLREEDQDGDTTVCEVNSYFVNEHLKVEAYFSACKVEDSLPPNCNELPKDSKLDWAGEVVQELLGRPHAKGVTPRQYIEEILQHGENALAWLRDAISDPQGPTGLESDLGADLMARFPFYAKKSNGKVITAREAVESNKTHWLTWVACALRIQTSIDWQKRGNYCWGFTLEVAKSLWEKGSVSLGALKELLRKAWDKGEVNKSTLCFEPTEVNSNGSKGFCKEGLQDKKRPLF